jgi:hypothetical protein
MMIQPRTWLVRLFGLVFWIAVIRFFVPEKVRAVGFLVGLGAFVVWLIWDTRREKRELAQHLEKLEDRKRASRRAKEAARSGSQPGRNE